MKRIAAILLMLCLLAGVVPAGAEADPAVATVDGVPILESELGPRLAAGSFLSDQSAASDQERAQKRREVRRAALEQLVEEQVLLNEAERRGIRLIGAVQADADQRYDRMIASVESYVLSSYPDLTQEELGSQVDALLGLAGASREQYRSDAQRAAILSALDEALCGEMPQPSQEELAQAYDALYAQQKALFDQSENELEAALLGGGPVVYRPRTLKLIQKAEFTFDPGAIALIRQTKAVSPEDAQAMEKDQYLRLADEVEPVYEALLAGSRTFEDVLEELEPGSSGKVNYFHPDSTRFGESYYSRADAFTTVGEISTAYVIPNGYAILRYAGDLEACQRVPLEEVREPLTRQLSQARREEYLARRKAELVAGAQIWLAPEGP